MSKSPNFKEALEKFKISFDLEFQKGYDYVIDKIRTEEFTASQVYIYSKYDDNFYPHIRRDIGSNESALFLRGFLKACNDIIEKSEK